GQVRFHVHHQLTDRFLVLRGHVEQMRFKVEKSNFCAVMVSQIPRPFQQRFMPAFDRGPASIVADQRSDHHAPAFSQRLQHHAGNAEHAIVIVRAEREEGLGHQGPNYTIFACPTTFLAWRAMTSSSLVLITRTLTLESAAEITPACSTLAAPSRRTPR